MKSVLMAGASGFIGSALIQKLLEKDDVEIIALSRSERPSDHPRVIWKKCDLFSLKDISDAMVGCTEAYYLVHSMLPSASLSQGTFYDFDLIMADNFIRAAHQEKLQHIIYLGGMIPEEMELSWHLKSRLEVETVFREADIPLTVLRAGIIIGPGGSSFTMLEKLIRRLPVMITPSWTKTRSQPVALRDVVNVLSRALYDQRVRGNIYDIGGSETVTYRELILRVARKIRKSNRVLSLDLIPLSLSRWWVTVISGMPKNLVYPLILSLRHEMLTASDHHWPFPEDLSTSLDESIDLALVKVDHPRKYIGHVPEQKDVRSVQRLILPPGKNAEWVAQDYFGWLPTFFSTLVKVDVQGDRCTFYLFDPSIKILILRKSPERSSPDRQLLYVIGGLLAAQQGRGRLEFREIMQRKYVMAALHEFRPALPWYIYCWSQAIVHLVVMKSFGEHLKWIYLSEKRSL